MRAVYARIRPAASTKFAISEGAPTAWGIEVILDHSLLSRASRGVLLMNAVPQLKAETTRSRHSAISSDTIQSSKEYDF